VQQKAMTTYLFGLKLRGEGATEAEAWRDAIQAFTTDPGEAEEVIKEGEQQPAEYFFLFCFAKEGIMGADAPVTIRATEKVALKEEIQRYLNQGYTLDEEMDELPGDHAGSVWSFFEDPIAPNNIQLSGPEGILNLYCVTPR